MALVPSKVPAPGSTGEQSAPSLFVAVWMGRDLRVTDRLLCSAALRARGRGVQHTALLPSDMINTYFDGALQRAVGYDP